MKRANLRREWLTIPKAGWSWGIVSAINSEGRTIWIADAHRGDGKPYVVHADEILTAFLELERAIRYSRVGDAFFSGANPRGLPYHSRPNGYQIVKLFCHACQNLPKERVKAENEFSMTRDQRRQKKMMNPKIISKIPSVKQAFHRLRQYIHWMRSGIKC